MVFEFTTYLEQKIQLNELGFFPMHKRKEGEVFIYHRELGKRTDILGISLHSYNKKEKGIFIGCKHFVKGISFNILNEIFEKAEIELLEPFWYDKEYYNSNKILSQKHPNWEKPFNKYPNVSENLLLPNKKINEKKTDEVCRALQNIIEIQILPFYSMYPDLQSVNDEIINEFETVKELSNYISGQIGFKKMGIMGLCNNPRYSEYIEKYEEKLRKGVQQNKEKYQPYLDFFYRLKDVLKRQIDNQV